MGKIKGFLFAVRHREILMTDLGLCLAESATYVEKRDLHGKTYMDEKQVNMVFHDVSNSVQDYIICLNSCISRSQNKEDKYFFLEILWLLDKTFIDVNHLTEAIKKI